MNIIQGQHGLFYGTDKNIPNIFVASPYRGNTVAMVKDLQRLFQTNQISQARVNFRYPHILMVHEEANELITVPEAEWQTEQQRNETLDLLASQVKRIRGGLN